MATTKKQKNLMLVSPVVLLCCFFSSFFLLLYFVSCRDWSVGCITFDCVSMAWHLYSSGINVVWSMNQASDVQRCILCVGVFFFFLSFFLFHCLVTMQLKKKNTVTLGRYGAGRPLLPHLPHPYLLSAQFPSPPAPPTPYHHHLFSPLPWF